jgi:hypothetical protein
MANAYACQVPRITRDVTAIDVNIDPHGAQPEGQKALGRGTAEEGGGLLRGGLKLMNRFTADVKDPEAPFDIVVTVAAVDGWLAAESVTVSKRPDGPAVTAADMRTVALSLYLQRIRQELQKYLGGGLLWKETARGEGYVAYDLPVAGPELDRLADMRRAVRQAKITPEMAAEVYKEALASHDPEENQRPVAAAAERLGVSRGHVSRLISEARKNGIPGLGAGRPSRRKDAK